MQFILFTTSVVTIGVNKTAYSANEDASSVSITLSVQIGALDRDVVVTLSSINGTAKCKFCNDRNPLLQLVCILSSLQLEKSTQLCLPMSLSMPVHQLTQ